MLAACYVQGHGVPKNMGEAERLYNLAAEQGHTSAQRMLATIARAAGRPAVALAVPREAAREIAKLAQSAKDPVARAAVSKRKSYKINKTQILQKNARP
jgi:TPR repeat protein